MGTTIVLKQHFLFPKLTDDASVSKATGKPKAGAEFSVAPPTGKAIKIDVLSAECLLLMSGYRHLDEIRRICRKKGLVIEPDWLKRLVDRFVTLGIVTHSQAPGLPGPQMPTHFSFANDTKFPTGHCSAYCRRTTVGPLARSYAEAIAAHPFVRDHPFLKTEALFNPIDASDPQSNVNIARSKRGCVFLDNDSCLLETGLGYAAKPQPCRAEPFRLMQTSEGNFYGQDVLDDRMLDAFTDGLAPGDERAPERIALGLHDLAGRRFRRPEVPLVGEYRLAMPVYLRFEDRLIGAIEAHPAGSLVEILQRLIMTVVWLPSIAPQLTNVIEAIHDLDVNKLRLTAPFWESFVACYKPIVDALMHDLRRGAAHGMTVDMDGPPPVDLKRHDLYDCYHSLSQIQQLFETSDPDHLASMTVEAQTHRYLRHHLVQFIYRKGFLFYPNLASALSAQLFGYFVVREGANRRYSARGDVFRTARDVAEAQAAWNALLRNARFRGLLTPRDEMSVFFDAL